MRSKSDEPAQQRDDTLPPKRPPAPSLGRSTLAATYAALHSWEEAGHGGIGPIAGHVEQRFVAAVECPAQATPCPAICV
jgi:hypothetical protein